MKHMNSFVLFDQKAHQVIGKSCERLQALYSRFDIPPEISAVIGQKYNFIVKVSSKSIDNEDLSFEVVYVKEQFGKQTRIPTVRQTVSTNIVPAAQTSVILPFKHYLPLVPIKPKTKEIQVSHTLIKITFLYLFSLNKSIHIFTYI